ncbi:MAG: ATP-binding cassette domain-containing protein [Dehalococcoidia bacterium]|nr:ATP-binding cassette domain-containing protein [Dehalococcoidia bacterium]
MSENVRLGAYCYRSGKDRTRTEEDLEKVFALFPRLAERRRQKAGTLSGGEQQMLAIGRRQMGRPGLVLLDEPSLGLAPILIDAIFSTIRELRQSGITILLVEQNVRIALDIADRGYVLQNGRIALEGPSDALLGDDLVKSAYLGVRPR